METQKKFLSKIETAVALGLSIATVNRRLIEGSIPSQKLGSRILIPAAFISQLEAQAMNNAMYTEEAK
jgi:hypothetical protein